MRARTAFLFPGQGSQYVGMGCDLAKVYPAATRIYEQADEVLGFELSELCFNGPEEVLNDTVNTQPAIYVTSMAVVQVLHDLGRLPEADMMAGHSMGELTALTAAGAMTFVDGLLLVRERGRLMKLAGERNPGGMAAVLKVDDEQVDRACKQAREETGKPVQVANYNCPGQVVISGDREALDRTMALLREQGGRRIVPLAVSIAAHSPLMAPVADDYRAAVDAAHIQAPLMPVIGNISARPLLSAADVRDELAGQLTWPVRWTDSMVWMAEQGVTCFVEMGPKDVLSKLVARIVPNAEMVSVGDAVGMQALGV
ncbi:MAG: ACP S-malonyltransferase [Anaerolineae bacterium]|nr:ACP S-malonyltransferase [Anaerolineae bacterium]